MSTQKITSLIEDYKLKVSAASQHSRDIADAILVEILELLVSNGPSTSADTSELETRIEALEKAQKVFSKFDGDGDGKPGGRRKKTDKPNVEETPKE